MLDALRVEHLVKHYGAVEAVRDVGFSVSQGEIFGLLGPNGAGKTSIISTIVSLEVPTSGKVSVFGLDPTKSPKEAKIRVGYVPQEVINHGYFSVDEILHLHSGFFGLRKNRARIDFLISRLGLEEHRNKKVRQLSGGMKRRLMIAKALVHTPKLLLLDEPTAGVDIELRSSLWSFVEELRNEGVSVLLTTHYLEEAEQLCDRVGVIHRGQMLRAGPTKELIKSLTHKTVRILFNGQVAPLKHRCLISQKEDTAEFRLPQGQTLGELLLDVGLELKQVRDVHIVEGDLEDAFRAILKKDAQMQTSSKKESWS